MKFWLAVCFLIVSNMAVAQIKPANGLWATADDPAIGSGLMMTTQNGITLISVFTYNESGQNIWYIASGSVDDNGVLEAQLRQTENGQNLLLENPQAASFTEETRTLKLEFQGSQLATMQIGEAEPKVIRPNHFGIGVKNNLPDMSGQWVIASTQMAASFILNLTEKSYVTVGGQVVRFFGYSSNHPSLADFELECLFVGNDSEPPSCNVMSSNELISNELFVDRKDIGNDEFVIEDLDNEPIYQAFRLNQDRRLLPNDGHWRPADDPDNGSGIVMRTQGDYTVVIIYSYDENGQPKWQNAAGQFDENGKLMADLYTPNNGTAIEGSAASSAAFEGEPQTLVMELEGTELATFSIDGSAPKYMQNFNFGVEIDNTNHLIINGTAFVYPDQTGSWVLVDEEYSVSKIKTLSPFDLNSFQTPPDPRLYEARQYEDVYDDEDSFLTFFCIKNLSSGNIIFQIRPYCYGYHFIRPNDAPLKVYFEDIGFKEFRYYIGEEFNGQDYSNINRNSQLFYMFRLN